MSGPVPVDLDNRTLSRRVLYAAGLAGLALLAGAYARSWSPATFAPGAPLMQMAAMVGALCLFGAATGALSKRFGAGARQGFQRHIWLSLTGVVLVAFHSTAALLQPPALMLLLVAGLAVAGWWGRTHAAVTLSQSFGRKPAMLSGTDRRVALRALVAHKTELLTRLDAGADEGQFSLQPTHWLRAPLTSWHFHRAVSRERALLGAHQIYLPADRYWRAAHQLLAWSLLLGILIHVLLCTFFAAYVAEGRPIYWWHVSAWDF